MSFSKILCPVDFSPGSEQALRVAARLAATANSELVLVHSWYVPAIAYSELPYPAVNADRLIEEARRGLGAAIRVATDAGAKRVSSMLLPGVPWVEIVDCLEAQPFDLCVIGTHGRTGLSRILLGSVAEKVIRHSPCSVLAVRPDGAIGPFRKLLVPTDFSASAQHAVELAAWLVVPDGEITLVHVLEIPIVRSGAISAELAPDLDRRCVEALEQTAVRLRSLTHATVTTRTRMGYPGAQTLAVQDDDRSIDLVVMGSHGRTGIARALLGSVAEKVVRHAHCPVLVARKRA